MNTLHLPLAIFFFLCCIGAGAQPATIPVKRTSVKFETRATTPAGTRISDQARDRIKPSDMVILRPGGLTRPDDGRPAPDLPGQPTENPDAYLELEREGPHNIPFSLEDNFEADVDLVGSDLLSIYSTVFRDGNIKSGYYYYLPKSYNLGWSPVTGKYDFNVTYGVASASGPGRTTVTAILHPGLRTQDMAIARDLLTTDLKSKPEAQFGVKELIAMPMAQTPEIEFTNLSQFGVSAENISLRAPSDLSDPILLSFTTDQIDALMAMFFNNIGLYGDVIVYPDGSGMPASIRIPFNLKIDAPETFGHLQLQGADWRTNWHNPTDYPIYLGYLHVLREQPGGYQIYSWKAGETEVPEGARVNFEAPTIPEWIDTDPSVKRIWMDYAIAPCEGCNKNVKKKILGSVNPQEVARPEKLEFTILTPLAFTEASLIRINVRSFQASAGGDVKQELPTVTVNEDGVVLDGGTLYVRDGKVDFEYKIQVYLEDGTKVRVRLAAEQQQGSRDRLAADQGYHCGIRRPMNFRPFTLCLAVLTPLLLLLPVEGASQALRSSLQTIAGVDVYRDVVREHRFYYLPGALSLGREGDGRPRFQLLQMRYTGTGLVGDQGAKAFFNVVQLGVERDPVSSEQLRAIREALGPEANLDPLPISSVEAVLVMPLGTNDGRYRRIGRTAGGESEGDPGGGDWTQRYFTVRLDPHEAELLWDQVEAGHLGFSVAYAYYADLVDDTAGEVEVSGDSASRAELDESLAELTRQDSTASPHAIRTGNVPLSLDIAAWPDLCRRIDLNEGAPPAWAFLELRCYDFANQLRPDLAMKTVELSATGVTGAPINLRPIRFLAARPEEHTRQVRFPYAIDLGQPYRYRVVEYTLEGEARPGNWQTAGDWVGLLDLTTPPEQIPYSEHAIEIEADTAAFRAAGVERVDLHLLYRRDGIAQRESVSWDLAAGTGSPWQFRRFYADKNAAVAHVLVTTSGGAESRVGPLPVGPDQYLFLRPPRLAAGTE